MHHNTKIRTVTRDDSEAIVEVYRQCEDFLALGPEPKASMTMVIKDIEECWDEGGVFRGIFNAEDKMIGVAGYVPSGFESKPEDAFMSLLMIAAPYRGQGIGARVVRRIEKEICRNPSIKSILSAVQVNNPDAIKFWQKNGYKIVSSPEPRPDKTTVYRLRKDL
jgi:ribosomal protein S18 acetylase RimI-like enzyme